MQAHTPSSCTIGGGVSSHAALTADVAAADGVAGLLGGSHDAVDQPAGDLVQVLVAAGAVQDFKRLDAGSHGQRVARQRACVCVCVWVFVVVVERLVESGANQRQNSAASKLPVVTKYDAHACCIVLCSRDHTQAQ